MKLALKWIAGVLFLISSFTAFAAGGFGILGGILLIIAGAICIPPSLSFIEEKLNYSLSKRSKYFVVIGCWFIGAAIIPKTAFEKLSNKENSERTKSKDNNNDLTDRLKQKEKLDSTIAQIKKEKDFVVEKVEYTADSVLKISIKTSEEINAKYFDIEYNVLKIGNVSEIEVLKKGVTESVYGYHSANKYADFKNNFVSSWDGSCRPVEKYIKANMNDPDSYKHDKTFVTSLTNGNFEIKTVFRGKNSFGAMVLNSAYAEVTPDGQVKSFRIE